MYIYIDVVYTQHEVFKMTNIPESTLIIIKNATTFLLFETRSGFDLRKFKKKQTKKNLMKLRQKKTEALNESPGQQQQQ